jgi:hypothetical protein
MNYVLCGGKCDVCGKPATHWFRDTCARLCNDLSCNNEHERMWDEEFKQEGEA